MFFVVERLDGNDGAKDLLLIGLAVGRQTGEYRWLHEVAVFAATRGCHWTSSTMQVATFLFGCFDTAQDFLLVRLANDRAQVAGWLMRVAYLHLASAFYKVVDESFVHRFLHQDS